MSLFYKIKRTPYNIKLFFERGRRGYSSEDWFSIRDWISDTLGPQLVYWSNHSHSYPTDIKGIENYEQWEDFLRKSGEALIRYKEIQCSKEFSGLKDDPLYKEQEKCSKQIEKFFKIFGKYFYTFWD